MDGLQREQILEWIGQVHILHLHTNVLAYCIDRLYLWNASGEFDFRIGWRINNESNSKPMSREYKFTPKFQIYDTIYLAVPGSDPYLISDITFSIGEQCIIYELMRNDGAKMYRRCNELSLTKIPE